MHEIESPTSLEKQNFDVLCLMLSDDEGKRGRDDADGSASLLQTVNCTDICVVGMISLVYNQLRLAQFKVVN